MFSSIFEMIFIQLYKESLKIKSYKTIESTATATDDDDDIINLNSDVGTSIQLDESSSSSSSVITIIDPFDEYIKVLEECFDFNALKDFSKKYKDFNLLFDGMHGAGGPFGKKYRDFDLLFDGMQTLTLTLTLTNKS